VSDVTRIFGQIQAGESGAAERLLPLVYRELRRLAAAKVGQERSGGQRQHDATSLVHEAYLRLLGSDGRDPRYWDNRGHFFAAAAEAMRRILVDDARKRNRPKHGGDRKRVDLEQDCLAQTSAGDDLVELDEALSRLAAEDPDKAQVVKLRYFAGLSLEETAAALGISPATAKRRWAYARAWLYSALTDSQEPSRRPANG
jgi:RNA polymerase sigma factor (TIGR02999 family)